MARAYHPSSFHPGSAWWELSLLTREAVPAELEATLRIRISLTKTQVWNSTLEVLAERPAVGTRVPPSGRL